MKKNILTNNKAFSLLEVTVVIIILTILASAAIPVLSRSYLEKAGNKTALDISEIQEAARAYYIDHNQWPDTSVYATPIAALQAGNYLPSSWNVINPFGVNAAVPSNYLYVASSSGSIFTVDTYVPTAAEPIIQNLLPVTSVSGNTMYSSVSVPGGSILVPVGIIAAWSGTIGTIPSGWTLCNGVTVSRSDGHGTITPPDLRDRFVIGASQDNSGVAMTTVTGSPTQSGNGQLPSTTVSLPLDKVHTGYPGGNATASMLGDSGIAYTITFGTGSMNIAVYYALAFIMKI